MWLKLKVKSQVNSDECYYRLINMNKIESVSQHRNGGSFLSVGANRSIEVVETMEEIEKLLKG